MTQTSSSAHPLSGPQTHEAMCQSEFSEHTSKIIGLGNSNRDPIATRYRSGLPINSLLKSTLPPDDQIICAHHYQSLSGSLNWINMRTRPNPTRAVALFLAYNHNPRPKHLKAVLYALWYVHSTPDLGITISSVEATEPHDQICHPFPNEK